MQQLSDDIARQLVREENIELRQYWNVICRRKWMIMGLAFAVTVIAAFVVAQVAPVYRATTMVMIESKEANVVSIADVYGLDTTSSEYFQTQFEILKSRPLAEKVIVRLDLGSSPEFADGVRQMPLWVERLAEYPLISEWLAKLKKPQAPAPASSALAERVNRYQALLQISPVPKTQLVKVNFESHDPAQAAAVANAHAQAFIESHLDAKENMARVASEWMSVRMDDMRQKLTAAENRLQEFRERERLVDVEGIQALPARELNELSTKLADARRELSRATNAYSQVEDVRFATLDEKLAIPAIKADPLVQQFRQARAEADLRVAELSKRYGELHPKMTAAVSERDAAERSLARQVDSVMDAIRNEHEVLKAQAQAIASAMNSAKQDVQRVGRKESEYRALSREVETARQLHDLFYQRISETKETGDLASANARIIEPATTPLHPVKPQKSMIVVLAFVLTLLIAILLAFFLEMLDTTVKHAADVERKIGLPLLTLVPFLRRKKRAGSIATAFSRRDIPEFGEAIRTARTGITLNNVEEPHKLIMVTSSVSAEGKTSVACNLALAFAQLERVLLVDADMRRPSVAGEFELGAEQPGLAELCAGTVAVEKCIVRDESRKLDILTAGHVPLNPQELLGSRRLQATLIKLKSQYDRIIIDCPPVLPVSDSLLLANLADALVYVVKADSTSTSQVKSGVRLIRRTPITLLGVVLNQVDVTKLMSYGEYGGGYYGGYAAGKAG